jgi:UDP-4-amino-4,6-dideoxy-N-acetyl-beta-L-altrosamine N-acetyltransferase
MTGPGSTQAELRLMRASDLPMVLAWRNHPEVRRCMRNQDVIELEEHLRWFDVESSNAASRLLVLEVDAVPLGYVKFTLAGDGTAEWGFYAAPEAPRGTGRILGETALRYAFETLGLSKVVGHAIASNERSIRFHRNMGFSTEECTHRGPSATNAETPCFGLSARNWRHMNHREPANGP